MNRSLLRSRTRLIRLFCAAILAVAVAPSAALAAANLLKNGDFAAGSVDQPDNWRIEAWINKPDAFQTHWIHSGSPTQNQMEVENLQANDGRWMQSLSLTPGWYLISADIRTENVGKEQAGASISVMEDGIMSEDIRGTKDWRHVSLYLRVGGQGADIDVALRVGGFGSLNTGRGFFRNATLVRVSGPPPDANHVFDLAAIRLQAAPEPIGKPYSLVLTFAALIAIAIFGWRMFGQPDPVAESTDAAITKKTARRQARR
jgi:hypothetical protein